MCVAGLDVQCPSHSVQPKYSFRHSRRYLRPYRSSSGRIILALPQLTLVFQRHISQVATSPSDSRRQLRRVCREGGVSTPCGKHKSALSYFVPCSARALVARHQQLCTRYYRLAASRRPTSPSETLPTSDTRVFVSVPAISAANQSKSRHLVVLARRTYRS